jgi:hypothetical protein
VIEPLEVLGVVLPQVGSAFEFLGFDKPRDDFSEGVRLRHGRQPLRVADGTPSRPLFEGFEVAALGLCLLGPKVPTLAAPLNEELPAVTLPKRWGAGIHGLQPSTLAAPDSRCWGKKTIPMPGAPGFIPGARPLSFTYRKPLQNNDLRHSPSRTRTYNLAVNSRYRCGLFDPVKIGYLVKALPLVRRERMVYNGDRMSPNSPRTVRQSDSKRFPHPDPHPAALCALAPTENAWKGGA